MFNDTFIRNIPEEPVLAARLIAEQFATSIKRDKSGDYERYLAAFAFVRGYCRGKAIAISYPKLSGDKVGDAFSIENFFKNFIMLVCDAIVKEKFSALHKAQRKNAAHMPIDSISDTSVKAGGVQEVIYSLTKNLLEFSEHEHENKSKILKYIKELQKELDRRMVSVRLKLDDSNRAQVVCQNCQTTRTLDMAQFKELHKPVKVKCRCGFVFTIIVDMRKYGRKEVYLPGVYRRPGMDAAGEAMIIENISKGGIGFRTKVKHNVKLGEGLIVRFILDDDKLREVYKKMHVMYVDERFIGARFSEVDGNDLEISSYLTSNRPA